MSTPLHPGSVTWADGPASTDTESILTVSAKRARRPAHPLVKFGHWWWALPALILMVAAIYVSTIIGGFYSFTDWSGIGAFKFVGLANYERLLSDPKMVKALINTLVLAFGFVIGTNVLGIGLALALNRTVRSRYVLRALLFMPVILGPLAVSYLWRFIFELNGPFNGFLQAIGLEDAQRLWLADANVSLWVVLFVMIWQASGISMVVYLAGLASVPIELEEAAALDGAGVWQRFRRIVLPSIRSAAVISLTLTTIQGLRTFDQILALTGGGPAGSTETMATVVYKQAFTLGNFGYGAAIAVVLTLIILIFAVLQQAAGRNQEA